MADALESFDQFTAFVDSDGNPLSFGSVKFGTAGGDPEAAPKNPDADLNYTVPTYTSIQLNADGKMSTPAFFSGSLSVSVYDADGAEIYASENMEQAAPIVISSTQVWRDNATGLPLSSGKLYFGEIHKDPFKSPKNVYSDSGFSTSIGSIVTLDSSGTTGSDVHLSGEYSLKVADFLGVQVGYEPKYIVISPAATGCTATANWEFNAAQSIGVTMVASGGSFVADSDDMSYYSMVFNPIGSYATGVRKDFLEIVYECDNLAAQISEGAFDSTPDYDHGFKALSATPPTSSGDIYRDTGLPPALISNDECNGYTINSTPSGRYKMLWPLDWSDNKDLVKIVIGHSSGYSGAEVGPNKIHCIEFKDIEDIENKVDLLAPGYLSAGGSGTQLVYNAGQSRWEAVLGGTTSTQSIAIDTSSLGNGCLVARYTAIGIEKVGSTQVFFGLQLRNVSDSAGGGDILFTQGRSFTVSYTDPTEGQVMPSSYRCFPLDDSYENIAYLYLSLSTRDSNFSAVYLSELWYVPV